ncbi:MAG TPA: hypothetical protein VFA85_17080 [Terriglobales bacterium]|nr:hypothetical protein [Terriglobales bacterium]
MLRMFADVEYFGTVYRDAELINGQWYFDRPLGGITCFALQRRVRPLHEPRPYRLSTDKHVVSSQPGENPEPEVTR